MVIIHCFLNNVVINVYIDTVVTSFVLAASYYIRLVCFRMC